MTCFSPFVFCVLNHDLECTILLVLTNFNFTSAIKRQTEVSEPLNHLFRCLNLRGMNVGMIAV